MAPRRASRSIPASGTVAALAGLLACLVVRPAAAEPPESFPESSRSLRPGPALTPDVYPPPSARTYALLGGFVSSAAWYSLALGSSYLWPGTAEAKDLRIPVAGPWLGFAHSGCGPVATCYESVVVIRAIVTALDGIGQAGGIAIMAQGLFLPTQEPARKRASWQPVRGVEMRPSFDAGKNTVGFGVLGVF